MSLFQPKKTLTVEFSADAGIGDRVNMAFQNSNVTYGRGLLALLSLVICINEVGHIAGMLQDAG